MLLFLIDLLEPMIRGLGVFGYITLRAVMATLTALAIGLLMGPWVIRRLTDLRIGQAVRQDGPPSDQSWHPNNGRGPHFVVDRRDHPALV